MTRIGFALVALVLVAGTALADVPEKEADEALAAFKKTYASKEESTRIAAVEQLSSVQHRRVADALAAPLKRDSSSSVRCAAAAALGGQWSPNAVRALVSALDPERQPQEVTLAVIAALGRTESDEAVPALVALLKVRNRFADGNDDPWGFTGPALDALGKLGSARAAVEVLEYLNRQANVARHEASAAMGPEPLIKNAMDALTAITGQHWTNCPQWRVWWSENRHTIATIQVYRCTNTGRTYDHVDSKKCPYDGGEHPECGRPLKTRFEGGGLGAPDVPAKKGKKS